MEGNKGFEHCSPVFFGVFSGGTYSKPCFTQEWNHLFDHTSIPQWFNPRMARTLRFSSVNVSTWHPLSNWVAERKPGDSSRDLLIPQLEVTYLALKKGHVFTIPKRSRSQNLPGSSGLLFVASLVGFSSW